MKTHTYFDKIRPLFLPLLLIPAHLTADTLSLNFVRGSSGESALAETDIAGKVPVANWNNTTTINSDSELTGIVLKDDTGTDTTAVATWQSGSASWSVVHTGTGSTGDQLMMTGYLDQGSDGAGQIHTVTIADIPYENYDVYLYHSSNGGPNRTARYQANGMDIFTRNLDPANVFDGFVRSGYETLPGAANLSRPAGNFILWENLSGSTLNIQGEGLGTLDGGAGGNTRRAPIQGIQIVERDAGLALVKNLAPENLTYESAIAKGELVSNGAGADEAAVTIFWGETDGGVDPASWTNAVSVGMLSSPGVFEIPLNGLVGNTTYYYRASASNSAGEIFAPFTLDFTTEPDPVLPEIENQPATGVAIKGATLNAELLHNGPGNDSSEITLYWGTVDGGTDANSWQNSVGAGTFTAPGTTSAEITGLNGNTRYYFRSYAENSSGGDWAPQSSNFMTLPELVQAISLNFVRGSSGETSLDPTDLAGVAAATNWNNTTTANADFGTDVPLSDSFGNATGALATWQSGAASWSVVTAGTGSAGDMKMMTGYLDQSGDGNGQIHTITVTNIPYPVYTVYLYHSSSGGPDRTARYQANGIDLFTRNLNPANTFNGFVKAQYETLADAALLDNPAGNYVVWENLSGDLTIEGQGIGAADGGNGGNTRRAPIQGIQIVASAAANPLQITDIVYDVAAGTVDLTFNSVAGLTYAIDSSTALDAPDEEWSEVQDTILPDAESYTYTHTLQNPAPSKLFYRVRIQQ